jgi:hypothetical protein
MVRTAFPRHQVHVHLLVRKPGMRRQAPLQRLPAAARRHRPMTGPVLSWEKPARIIPAEEWQSITADNAPPGVYIQNMSREDTLKWKARLIGGQEPRIEIRKTAGPAQILIIVRPGEVRMSMNGTAVFRDGEVTEMHAAIMEAEAELATRG